MVGVVFKNIISTSSYKRPGKLSWNEPNRAAEGYSIKFIWNKIETPPRLDLKRLVATWLDEKYTLLTDLVSILRYVFQTAFVSTYTTITNILDLQIKSTILYLLKLAFNIENWSVRHVYGYYIHVAPNLFYVVYKTFNIH